MKDWKKFFIKILFLPIWLIMIFTVITTVALIMVFVNGRETSPIAYVIYLFSFYTLVVVCIACWKYIPNNYMRAKSKVYDNEYANKYLTDVAYKTQVKLYCSLVVNLVYVAINGISGIVYSTHWFGIFAIYYAIMAVMRFLLVRYVNANEIGKSPIDELKLARICSYILMMVNGALSAAVLMMINYERGFEYKGFLIYVVALYTFYVTINAIIEIVKYRKYKSPVMSVSKIIKLTSALFSMLFLETAMFSQFGADTSVESKRIMIMATGAGISVIVVVMSIYMIVRTSKEINYLQILNSRLQ